MPHYLPRAKYGLGATGAMRLASAEKYPILGEMHAHTIAIPSRTSRGLIVFPCSFSPAEEPATVLELEDLPTGKVKKLAAAGYLLMALTEGNDLYAWGGHPGLPGFLDNISASPSPVVIEDHDIADCAIGQSHAVVLTMNGEVYTAGANANGQLSITTETDSPWSRVPFSPGPDGTIVSVACGPRNSFMIVQKNYHHA